jgi:hypothetical protein
MTDEGPTYEVLRSMPSHPYECSLCGALTTNWYKHTEWHLKKGDVYHD